MVVASFLDVVQLLRVTHYLLEGSRRAKRSSKASTRLADRHHDFLSIDLTIALASGLAQVLGSQRRFLRHSSKCRFLLR
jgi:hypothetical protein